MSETKKKVNAVPACSTLKTDNQTRGIEIIDGAKGPSRDDVAVKPGMEIPAPDAIVTNDTKDGRAEFIDKATGKLIGYIDGEGTLHRLAQKDKEDKANEQVHE